ncbi:MAG: cell division protein FtsA [Anaerolineae bacterium]|nr:cell division protein FtsA [Anaerolineae bacterium]
MTDQRILVALDVGTTKTCMLVGEVGERGKVRILGYGIESSTGMNKGTVIDVNMATEAILSAKRQAERTSGFEIGRTYVSVAGKHITSINSKGVTGLNPGKGVITREDVDRALQAARAVAMPHNREILHVIPRTFMVDGQEGIRNPLGLHAYRLEVEAHIITAASSALRNLEKAVNDAGLAVDRFVLNPLASAEAVLTDAERESGVVLIDIGGGTTDISVYIEGTVWHSAVIEVGGSHITNDIAMVLHLPVDEAERVKVMEGNVDPETVAPDAIVTVQPFGEEMSTQILRYDLAQIIEARVDEIFTLVMQDLKRSGYDGLLPAGVVLTGGAAGLKHIRNSATRIMNLPVRVAQPDDVGGLADKIKSPAFSTAIGLLRFAYRMDAGSAGPGGDVPHSKTPRGEGVGIGKAISNFLERLLPD